MSLLQLTKDDPESRAVLNEIMPSADLPAPRPLKFPALTKHGSIVGTAFDYLSRFEIEARQAIQKPWPWVAEVVAHKIRPIAVGKAPPKPANGIGLSQAMTKATAGRWISMVEDARRCHSEYLTAGAGRASLLSKVAGHALTLARIDPYFRAGYVDGSVGVLDSDDLADLLALFAAVPWDRILSEASVRLNPNFGMASVRVGGADADLIVGTTLFDFKAATKPVVREDLRQLLGYLLLAREARRSDAAFPNIEHLAIYYARHGSLTTFPADMFTAHPKFQEVSERFWTIAADRFPVKPPSKSGPRAAAF